MIKKSYDPVYEYKELKQYKEWEIIKQEIKSKYPEELFDGKNKKVSKETRQLFQQYLKELCDEMFKGEGVFQELTWEMMGEIERLEMERLARGRLHAGNGEYS